MATRSARTRPPDLRSGVAAKLIKEGSRLTGTVDEELAAVPFFRARQYHTTVSLVGHAEDYTHIQVDGSPDSGDCSASFMNDDQLLAYVSIGGDRESLLKEANLERELCRFVTSGGSLQEAYHD